MSCDPEICFNCGAKMVAYKHTINKGLIGVLQKMRDIAPRGSQVAISMLGMTNSQYSNYPKLAYWGLAKQLVLDGKVQGGLWVVTESGDLFLRGHLALSRFVRVLRNRVIAHSIEQVYVYQVDATYRKREAYIQDAQRPPVEDRQQALFDGGNRGHG